MSLMGGGADRGGTPSSGAGVAMVTTEQVKATAYHEAGHAVIAYRHCVAIREDGVSIDARRGWYTHVRPTVFPGEAAMMRAQPDPSLWRMFFRRVVAEVEISQAGWLAEYLFHGKGGPVAAEDVENECAAWAGLSFAERQADDNGFDDIVQAVFWLMDFRRADTSHDGLRSEDRRWVVHEYLHIQRRLLLVLRRARTWAAIVLLANTLVDRGRLDGDAVYSIIAAAGAPRAP